jgi:hypothetical protein
MRLPLTAALAVAGLSAACMEEDAAMFIEGVLPLVPEACEVQSTQTIFSTCGLLDLRVGRGYTANLKVRTNLPATFNNQDVQQSRSQSPNFPNYGAVDNNVVIFETAEVTFTLQSDADTVLDLAAAAAQVDGGSSLACSGGTCTSSQPEVIPAGGTAFNQQTSLNREALVTTELLSSSTAQTLLAVYEKAIVLQAAAVDDRRFLDVPGETQRLNVEVVLVGRTTGSQNLRLVRSAPFPFGIDICRGCLEPDAGFCRGFGDNVVLLPDPDAAVCIPGQDFASAKCGCLNADGSERDVINQDRNACAPPAAP